MAIDLQNAPILVNIDPSDIVRSLDNNDDMILTFICQMLAHAGSLELREHLAGRLLVFNDDAPVYDHSGWSDEDYI